MQFHIETLDVHRYPLRSFERGAPAVVEYEYELRRGAAVIATGRIQLEEQPTPGDTLSLGRKQVHVEEVLALRGGRRLILSQTS